MQYQKNEVRERIIAAATQEFLQNGYLAGRINKIALDAGVPVGNLYRYFATKDALFAAVVGQAYVDSPSAFGGFAAIFVGLDLDLCQGDTGDKVSDKVNKKVDTDSLAAEVTDLFDRHGMQIQILASKSDGSIYADFCQRINAAAGDSFCKKMVNPTADYAVCAAIGKGFCDMLIEIQKSDSRDSRIRLTKSLLQIIDQSGNLCYNCRTEVE